MRKMLYYVPVIGLFILMFTDESKVEWSKEVLSIVYAQVAITIILATWLLP